MANQRIDQLVAETAPAAADLLPLYSIAGSDTKRITVKNLIQQGAALVDNASIPVAKIASITEANLGNTSAVGQFVAGPAAATGALTKRRIVAADLPLATTSAVGGISASTGLAVSGAGALTVAAATTVAVGGISVPSSSGLSVSAGGVISHTASISPGTTSGVTVSASGHVTALAALVGADLPLATTSVVGGISVGSGFAVTGAGVLNHGATVTAATVSGITFNATGHITAATALVGADLPAATTSVKGGVSIPSGALSVNGSGAVTHDVSGVTAGTYPKVTVDTRGHVTAGAALDANDIPNISAAKLTSGTVATSVLGTNSITGVKLANYSTVQFGGAGSTTGIVTFPTPEFTGQGFFDSSNGDYYIYDGNTWQPLTVISGNLVYAGTYNASNNQVASVTTAGTAGGLVVGNALPAGSATLSQYYVVVSQSGNGVSPAPVVALAPPDMIICNGATWDLVDVSNAIAGQTATNISVTPYGNIASTNVQTAIQELDDEKIAKTGGTVTGELLIGTAGTFAFEGSTANAYETYLSATDPTADRAIVFPDLSGTVIISGNASIVNADISVTAAIVDTKLATIATAGKVSNSATTATNSNTLSAIVARDASGNFTAGTITAALTGVASSATALATARTIQGVSFDGTANITVATAGSGISVTGTAIANTGVLSVNGSTGTVTGIAPTASPTFTGTLSGSVGSFSSTLSDIIGNVRSIPQNAKTAAYQLLATDNGQHISITTGGVTVPSAIFTAGQVVTIFNNSASSQTITQGGSVTLRQAGTASTGNRTLAQYGVATILCVDSNTFVITGTGVT